MTHTPPSAPFAFLSYAREDRIKARRLQRHLEADGFSIWKDDRLIGGSRFDDVIERKVNESSCLLVLWSKHSVESTYVKDEATRALELGKLVPAAIEECEVPMRFRYLHTHALKEWAELLPGPDYERLKADVATYLRSGQPSSHAAALHWLARVLAAGRRWLSWYVPPIAVLLALVAIGLALYKPELPALPPVEPVRAIKLAQKTANDQLLIVGRLYEIRSELGSTMRIRIHEVQFKAGVARITASDLAGVSQDLVFSLDEIKRVHLASGTHSIKLDGIADNGALFTFAMQ